MTDRDAAPQQIGALDQTMLSTESVHGEPRLLWFVTFVTHNSRVSERMVTYGIHGGELLVFSPTEQVEIAGHIIDVCRRHQIAVCALNVLPDHVHIVLVACDVAELTTHVRKIKGYSAYAYNKGLKSECGLETGHATEEGKRVEVGNGLKPIVKSTGATSPSNNGLQPIADKFPPNQPVWAQKFHWKPITNNSELEAILHYVRTNHEKHTDRWGEGLLDTWSKGLQPLVESACVPPEEAVDTK